MGQQVSVETFSSRPDSDGYKYWASFDPYPFKVGPRKLAYMGVLNGKGPLGGQKCVVKALRRGTLSEKEWMLESLRSQVAMAMAKDYNQLQVVAGKKLKYRLSFSCPIVAQIDTLSDCMCINDILGKPRMKIKDSDYVSIEVYLRGRFEQFEYGFVHLRELLVPEAFSHFTWCRSEGKLLVSNLQGVKTANMYQFTSPVIHSESRKYGNLDQGYEGIKGFFRLHKCNRICEGWPRLGDGTDLRGWEQFMSYRDVVPTAPPLTMPPPYNELDQVQSYREISQKYPNRRDQQIPSNRDIAGYNHGNGLVPSGRTVTFEDDYQQSYRFEPYPMTQRNPSTSSHLDDPFIPHQMYRNQGMVFNSREMVEIFGNQGYQQSNHQSIEMQFMWLVKYMQSYAFNRPPPPYCTCMENVGNRQDNNFALSQREHDLEEEGDEKYLLPPPYTEESVDPQYDCVTYL